jgi:predicted O-methyltransferase YrrM
MSFEEFYKNIQSLPIRVGSINQAQQQFIRNFLIENPDVKHILETGFHVGVSAATMLSTRPDIIVTSFDIFWFDYTRRAKLFLDIAFPGRNTLIAGNSINTLPTFFNTFPTYSPDFIFIDGGHERPIPYIDLWYILNHVRPGTWIMIDDYCEEHGSQGVVEAVISMVSSGIISDVTAYKSYDRGWIFGKRSYIKMPDTDVINKENIDKLLRDTESHYT